MAAIVINTYSAQGTKLTADNFQPLKANELSGRVRCAFFNYVADGAQAANQVLAFTQLPAGARYLGGKVHSSGAVATADLDVGLIAADASGEIDKSATADDIDFLGDAIDIATAGVYNLLDTEPDALGYLLEKPCWVAGKLLTAGLADGDVLKGVIFYVTD